MNQPDSQPIADLVTAEHATASTPKPVPERVPLTPRDLRALANYWGIPVSDEDLEIIAGDMAEGLRRRVRAGDVDLGDTVPAFIGPLLPPTL